MKGDRKEDGEGRMKVHVGYDLNKCHLPSKDALKVAFPEAERRGSYFQMS